MNQCQIATLLDHLANLYALSSNYILIYKQFYLFCVHFQFTTLQEDKDFFTQLVDC